MNSGDKKAPNELDLGDTNEGVHVKELGPNMGSSTGPNAGKPRGSMQTV
jgi:hypothetical protein